MSDPCDCWQEELGRLIKENYPSCGELGGDTLEGLVIAVLRNQVEVIPAVTGQIGSFTNMMTEAQFISLYLLECYGEKVIMHDLKQEGSFA